MTVAAIAPLPHASAAARKSTTFGFWLLAGLIALVGAAKAITADTLDPDAFWHLRVADQLMTDGIGPLIDRISFASIKTPWTPYSWLGELLMRAIWRTGDFRLATVVTSGCSAAIVLLMAGAARLAARDWRDRPNDVAAALVTAVAAWFTLPFVSFRPVTFALVVMAAIVWIFVHERRRATAWIWAIVPLTVLLTNLHLYVAIIVTLAWLTCAGATVDGRSRFRSRFVLAVATTAAACCTPMLRGAVGAAIGYQADDPMVASPFITEMRPFFSGTPGRISLALFAAVIALCVARRNKLSLTDWLWLAFGAALLFRLGRFSPVFAMLAMPACARAMPKLGGRALARPVVCAALVVVLLAGVAKLTSALGERDFDRWLNRNTPAYPTAAAAFVAANVSPRHGRLVNEFNWGGYLTWRLGDHYQVLLDGRTQLYTPAFWRQTHLGDAASRRALLAAVGADAAVLPTHDSAFFTPLVRLGWREAYRDDVAVVMIP